MRFALAFSFCGKFWITCESPVLAVARSIKSFMVRRVVSINHPRIAKPAILALWSVWEAQAVTSGAEEKRAKPDKLNPQGLGMGD